jgi:hypothetical protein
MNNKIKRKLKQLFCRHYTRTLSNSDPSSCMCINCGKEMIYKGDYEGRRV